MHMPASLHWLLSLMQDPEPGAPHRKSEAPQPHDPKTHEEPLA